MSFYFNPSSDEEDFDEWAKREGFGGPADDDDKSVSAVQAATTKQSSTQRTSSLGFPPFATSTPAGFLENDFDKKLDSSSSDDESSIAWEDVAHGHNDDYHDNDNDDDNQKLAALPQLSTSANKTTLREVTVNLDPKGEDGNNEPCKKKRRVMSRKKFRVESLPQNMQTLLLNLHRAHLLALCSHAYRVSEQSSDPYSLSLGLSLIPRHLDDDAIPTDSASHDFIIPSRSELDKMCEWYFALVHQARHRRQAQLRAHRAAGAPIYRRSRNRQAQQQQRRRSRRKQPETNESDATLPTGNAKTEQSLFGPSPTNATTRMSLYAQYLANSVSDDPRFGDESPEAHNMQWSGTDQNQLLLSILRSLQWRVRYVLAMDPIPCDLTVNHPLLATSRNIFQSLAKNKRAKSSRKPTALADTPDVQSETEVHATTGNASSQPTQQFAWIEVLCRESHEKDRIRWIHVDSAHQLIDQPDQVEVLLKDIMNHSDNNCNNYNHHPTAKGRAVLGYAVAVEHTGQRGTKFVDVTQRYAQSFVATLRVRGLLRGRKSKQLLTTEQLRQTWWCRTIRLLNGHFSQSPPNQEARVGQVRNGTTRKEAITIDESSDSDDDGDDKDRKLQPKDLFAQVEDAEKKELHESGQKEAIPTSKAAFQTHPVYVLKSVLGKAEVLAPDASTRVCGVYKGEMVYRRSDVSTAYPARKWPYMGRQVRPSELARPIKRGKARKKVASKSFKALKSYGVGKTNDGSSERRSQDIREASQPLEDGMECLYAHWQTDAWSPPPVSPVDPIPVNEYNNVELELLNPGLVHIEQRGIAKVAKKLGIPYAPCMLGFEGHGGNRTPTIRGIVVHAHNAELLREAGEEVFSHTLEQESANRRKLILGRWKKLLVGLLTQDRLEREYGDRKEGA